VEFRVGFADTSATCRMLWGLYVAYLKVKNGIYVFESSRMSLENVENVIEAGA